MLPAVLLSLLRPRSLRPDRFGLGCPAFCAGRSGVESTAGSVSLLPPGGHLPRPEVRSPL